MQSERRIQRKRDFLRSLVAVMAAMLLLIIPFLAVFYSQSEKIMLTQAQAYTVGALRQARETVSNMEQEVVRLYLQMYGGRIIDLFSFSSDPNDYYVLDAMEKMDNYRFLSTYVKSVYVYSRVQNRVYVSADKISNKVQSAKGFYDADALELSQNKENAGMLSPILRQIPTELDHGQYSGFTYLFYDNHSPADSQTVMLVNVGEDSLTGAWDSVSDAAHLSIMALSPSGVVMVDNPLWQGLSADQQQTFRDNLLDEHIARDEFFTLQGDSGRILGMTDTPTANGWQCAGLMTDQSLSGDMRVLRGRMLAVAFLIFFGATAAACFTAYRLSRPLSSLRDQVSTLEKGQFKDLDQLTISALRRMLLSCRELPSSEELTRLHLDYPEDTRFRVLTLSNARCKDDHRQPAEGLLTHLADALELACLPLGAQVHAIDMGTDCMAMLFAWRDDGTDELAAVKQAVNTVHSGFDGSFITVLSGYCTSLSEISFLYNQACQYRVYRLYRGENCMLCVDEELANAGGSAPYPVKIERQMCESIVNLHFDAARRDCDTLLQALEQLPPMHFNMASTHLMYSIGSAVESFQHSVVPNAALNFNLDRLFNECDTIQEVRSRLHAVFDQLEIIYQENRTDRLDALAEQVNAFLNKEFRNSSLSLNMIADHMQLTPNYIGRLYKRATGCSVLDRIMQLRMDEARCLLTTTHMAVSEISEYVGFTGEGYFYKAFKLNNNCTPNEYRKTAAAET